MLMNMKMPTNVGIFVFISVENFILSTHESNFKILGLVFYWDFSQTFTVYKTRNKTFMKKVDNNVVIHDETNIHGEIQNF